VQQRTPKDKEVWGPVGARVPDLRGGGAACSRGAGATGRRPVVTPRRVPAETSGLKGQVRGNEQRAKGVGKEGTGVEAGSPGRQRRRRWPGRLRRVGFLGRGRKRPGPTGSAEFPRAVSRVSGGGSPKVGEGPDRTARSRPEAQLGGQPGAGHSSRRRNHEVVRLRRKRGAPASGPLERPGKGRGPGCFGVPGRRGGQPPAARGTGVGTLTPPRWIGRPGWGPCARQLDPGAFALPSSPALARSRGDGLRVFW